MSGVFTNHPLNSAHSARVIPPASGYQDDEDLWAEPLLSYTKAVEDSPPSYRSAARPLPIAAKDHIASRVADTNERGDQKNTQDLYSKLPGAEGLERVTEAEAKSILAGIHNEMLVFKDRIDEGGENDKNRPSANPPSIPSSRFNDKPFEYVIFKIQELFFLAAQYAVKAHAEADDALRQLFKTQIETSQAKERERREKIKEENAKAYKSGMTSFALDWGSAAFSFASGYGTLAGMGVTAAATGGMALPILIAAGWFTAGVAAFAKGGFELGVIDQRVAGNDKRAEEFEHAAKIAGGIEGVALLLTLFFGIPRYLALQAETANTKVLGELKNKVSASISEEQVAKTAEEIIKAHGFEVKEGAVQALKLKPSSLWESVKVGEKSYQTDLIPLIRDAISSQSMVARYMRRFFLAFRSLNMASKAWLRAQIAKSQELIQTLSQQAGALKKMAQTVTQQIIKENIENLQRSANQLIELLKAMRSWLASYAGTIQTAAKAMPVGAHF